MIKACCEFAYKLIFLFKNRGDIDFSDQNAIIMMRK